ncbi:MAG TPA: zinc-ribbon domain-containing protein [Candidatus Limnocylindria bacterium]|nr:zinc-ribbon domain-containing protein [Candidatus Limnocylindria bacterium]
MTYDERDRHDRPGEGPDHPEGDAGVEPPREPELAGEPVVDATTSPPPRSVDENAGSDETAEWPSADTAADSSSRAAWPTEPPAAGDAPADAWPTESPSAADRPAEAWPTTPPERGDDPILEPAGTRPTEPAPEPAAEPVADAPPSEVEAYPSAAAAPPTPEPEQPVATSAHAVPAGESATGESTQCPRCGTENRPGLAFCRNCGQRLVAAGVAATVERPSSPEGTQACPRCGTHNRAGTAFCQNCGANLRGVSEGYVPPAVAGEEAPAAAPAARRGAVLGPVVLLIGLVGLVTAYLLPFTFGAGSLFERAWGSGGYGIAFWSDYPTGGLAEQAYFGLAAAVPILGVIVLALAVAGFMRAAPGMLQTIGLVVALVWSVGLVVLFLVVELLGNWDGDLVGLLRVLSPAGIILFLTGLIVLIGSLTRFARS